MTVEHHAARVLRTVERALLAPNLTPTERSEIERWAAEVQRNPVAADDPTRWRWLVSVLEAQPPYPHRPRFEPRRHVIVRAQHVLLQALAMPHARAELECWACSAEPGAPLDRAHILAVRHGGSDMPENFFLLCWRCHGEQPDASPRGEQIAWLIGRRARLVGERAS